MLINSASAATWPRHPRRDAIHTTGSRDPKTTRGSTEPGEPPLVIAGLERQRWKAERQPAPVVPGSDANCFIGLGQLGCARHGHIIGSRLSAAANQPAAGDCRPQCRTSRARKPLSRDADDLSLSIYITEHRRLDPVPRPTRAGHPPDAARHR